MPERSLLLVEDNDDDVALAERALRKSGVRAKLWVARSGREAWQMLQTLLRDDLPDAMFIDLNMPEWNGFEVLERVRNYTPSRFLPVIILTTSKEPADIARCYSLGANSFVTKPVDFTEFAQMFARMTEYWMAINQPT